MKPFVISAIILFTLFISNSINAKKIPIDQVPMYGRMDRSSVPALKKGDEEFISNVTKQFGSRQAAASAWIDQGFFFYQKDELEMAMRRFNQAWLLDPNNPEVYWGFSSILYDKGDNCGAMQMGQEAEEVGIDSMIPPNQAEILADIAMITSVCAVSEGSKHGDKVKLVKHSDELFSKSESIWPSAYLYDKWWQALYWRGEYSAAWKKVSMMRDKGEEPYEGFIQLLIEKMPQPEGKMQNKSLNTDAGDTSAG